MRRHLPHGLTLFRMLLVPPAIALQQQGTAAAFGWCLLVLLLAELSEASILREALTNQPR